MRDGYLETIYIFLSEVASWLISQFCLPWHRLQMLCNTLEPASCTILVHVQILCMLWFLATGSFQREISDQFGMSQPTMRGILPHPEYIIVHSFSSNLHQCLISASSWKIQLFNFNLHSQLYWHLFTFCSDCKLKLVSFNILHCSEHSVQLFQDSISEDSWILSIFVLFRCCDPACYAAKHFFILLDMSQKYVQYTASEKFFYFLTI